MPSYWGGLLLARNLPSTIKTITLGRRLPERLRLRPHIIVHSSRPRNHSSSSSQFPSESEQQRGETKTKMPNPNPNPNPNNKVQQLLNSYSIGGWERCWEDGATPWDLGNPTPVLLHLLHSGGLPNGRALIPGCGSGYDVVAIAGPERYVVGLDISETAIGKAKELSSSSPNSDYLTFLTEDFFTWHPDELFDLIFDYTFFCALEPNIRSAWASRIHDLLKPDGELITLMFPVSDHVGGPPFKVSVADYKEVLNPIGFEETCIVDNELAVGPRKGKEKLGRWKRSVGQSLL